MYPAVKHVNAVQEARYKEQETRNKKQLTNQSINQPLSYLIATVNRY